MRFKGIPDHGEFGGCGNQEAFLQRTRLGGIDRQQGKAAVEFLPAVVVGRI